MKYKDKDPIAVYDPLNTEDDLNSEIHWEDFQNDLDEEFKEHQGSEVHVIGRDMGWQKLTGHKTFELKDSMDIFDKIKPNTNELTFYLYKMDVGKYVARISHHDAMGETYEIKLKAA